MLLKKKITGKKEEKKSVEALDIFRIVLALLCCEKLKIEKCTICLVVIGEKC